MGEMDDERTSGFHGGFHCEINLGCVRGTRVTKFLCYKNLSGCAMARCVLYGSEDTEPPEYTGS